MWKVIKDFPNYSISDIGEIKNNQTNKLLSICQNQEGYKIVQLWKEHKGYMKRIHRLVLETFSPCENMENLEVNHIDCNINNNMLSNLEWCTSEENTQYRLNLNHKRRQKVKVEFTNGAIEIYDTITECAKHFQIDTKTIYKYIKYQLTPKRKIQANFSFIT